MATGADAKSICVVRAFVASQALPATDVLAWSEVRRVWRFKWCGDSGWRIQPRTWVCGPPRKGHYEKKQIFSKKLLTCFINCG